MYKVGTKLMKFHLFIAHSCWYIKMVHSGRQS